MGERPNDPIGPARRYSDASASGRENLALKRCVGKLFPSRMHCGETATAVLDRNAEFSGSAACVSQTGHLAANWTHFDLESLKFKEGPGLA